MIIFCDVDGTLWRHTDTDFSELEANIAAIQEWRAAGNLFAIASGRSLPSLRRCIPNFTDFTDFFISDNGAFVYDRQLKPIFSNTLSHSQATDIIKLISSSMSPNDFRASFYNSTSETQQPNDDIGKIRIWFKSASAIDSIVAALNSAMPLQLKIHAERHAIKSSLPWIDDSFTAFINIVSIEAGKESAIEQLIAHENIPPESTLSIGDDLNDEMMLKHQHGHIMADSHPQLLAEYPPERQHKTVVDFIHKMLK